MSENVVIPVHVQLRQRADISNLIQAPKNHLTQAYEYGTVIAGGLAISKNLSLESVDIQAFVMERLPIVWDF